MVFTWKKTHQEPGYTTCHHFSAGGERGPLVHSNFAEQISNLVHILETVITKKNSLRESCWILEASSMWDCQDQYPTKSSDCPWGQTLSPNVRRLVLGKDTTYALLCTSDSRLIF